MLPSGQGPHRSSLSTQYNLAHTPLPTCATDFEVWTSLRDDGHHDSFEDAAVTMRLVRHAISLGGDVQPLPPPDRKVWTKEAAHDSVKWESDNMEHGIPSLGMGTCGIGRG